MLSAHAARHCPTLSQALSCAASLTHTLLPPSGAVDPRASFHERSRIFPVGYRAEWRDPTSGRLFVSEIAADEALQRPVFKARAHADACADACAAGVMRARVGVGCARAGRIARQRACARSRVAYYVSRVLYIAWRSHLTLAMHAPQVTIHPRAGRTGASFTAAATATPDPSASAPAPAPPPARPVPTIPQVAEGFSPEHAWEVAHGLGPGSSPEDLGEHFGIDAPEVARLLEGLPGVCEACRDYAFVEQFSDWDTESAVRVKRALSDEKRRLAAYKKDEGVVPIEVRARRAAAVAEERRKLGAMSESERVAHEAARREARDASKAAGEADKAERAKAREARQAADKAARAAAKVEAGKARDAARAANRERAAAEKEEAAAAKARRAKYPLDDALVAAAEAADAAAEGRPAPVYPPRPEAAPAPGWTGDLLALCAFFEERGFLSGTAAAAGDVAVAAARPGALRDALRSPGTDGAPLLSEMYSALLRALVAPPAWEGDAAGISPPALWARIAHRGGFAVWPELLRRWARVGCRFYGYDVPMRDAAARIAAGGPGAASAEEHTQLLLALCADLLDTGAARRALEGASEQRHELKKGFREEARASRDAARTAADAARDAKRRVDALTTTLAALEARVGGGGAAAAGGDGDDADDGDDAGGDEDEDGSGSDSDEDAGARADSDSDYGGGGGGGRGGGGGGAAKTPKSAAGKGGGSKGSAGSKAAQGAAAAEREAAAVRLELSEARAAADADAALATGAADAHDALEARHAKQLSAAAVRASPVGVDAAFNRYWWSPREPGALYVEDTRLEDDASGGGAGGAAWGRYSEKEELAALIAALNPNGAREGRLLEALCRLRPRFEQGAERVAARAAAVAAAAAASAPPAAPAAPVGTKRSREAAAAAAASAGAGATPGPPGPPPGPSYEALALPVIASETLHLMETVAAGGKPPLTAELRGFMRALREYASGHGLGGATDVVVSDFCLSVLAFEEELCRAVDPRAAGLTKAAARAAETAARRAAAAAASAAAAGEAGGAGGGDDAMDAEADAAAADDDDDDDAAAAAAPAPADADDDPEAAAAAEEAAARAAERDPMQEEAWSEIAEAEAVETKPSGGTSKPAHPPMWRQAAFRSAWRAALQRAAEAGTPAGAVGPLGYAVCALAERIGTTLASLSPKEFRKHTLPSAPPRAPAPKRGRGGGDLFADDAAYNGALFADGGGPVVMERLEESDIPRCLSRDVLEALCLEHAHRDVSRQKLAKHKIARLLPEAVLRAAVEAALAEHADAVAAALAAGGDADDVAAPPEKRRSSGRSGGRKKGRSGKSKKRRPAAAATAVAPAAKEDDGEEEGDDDGDDDDAEEADTDADEMAEDEPAAVDAQQGGGEAMQTDDAPA
jgi:hypothetical protein